MKEDERRKKMRELKENVTMMNEREGERETRTKKWSPTYTVVKRP